MDTPPKKNKRVSPRAPLRVGIDYTCEGGSGAGITQNISTGGLFVECKSCFGVGTMVEVEFQLPGADEPIQAMIWVVWEKAGQGFGCQFLNLSAESRDAIEDYVTRTMLRPKGGTTQVYAGTA